MKIKRSTKALEDYQARRLGTIPQTRPIPATTPDIRRLPC